MLHQYQVGEPYHPNRTRWPEGGQYNFRANQHELLLFMARPTAAEIRAIRTGQTTFAVAPFPELLFLLYRFDADPWGDAPYSWSRVPAQERSLPLDPAEMSGETRALLHITLVDAATGVIRALRVVSLAPETTRCLHEGIRQQAATPPSDGEYDRAVERIYRAYTTEQLVAAAIGRGPGG